jgi:UDP-3-O-[3-hydroxymyristoyl] glucosamine N-acyltransferase
MIDPRFFKKKDFLTMQRICEIIGIELPAGCPSDKRIVNITKMAEATGSDLTFFHNAKYSSDLETTKAFAILSKIPTSASSVSLIVNEPYLALALLLKELYSIKMEASVISNKASISKSAVIEEGCGISDFASIGDDCVIKKGTFIGANTTILPGVEIGKESYIESNVTVGFAIIGEFAYIKSGARIGQQGFGFHIGSKGITDVPQIGRVIVGHNTQIGANCTVDRGSMGDTIIGNNVRIDDMVHIAHNVEIGDYCVIAAQTGVAGSTKIGEACVLGGQVGVAGHITIGDNATIAAQSGIMKNIESGTKVAGSPGVSIMNWHRQNVILQKLVKARLTDNV